MQREAEGIKIVVLGSGGVGKSALTLRLISDEFGMEYDPTIEDSYRKQVTIDGQPALLDILDTAGQEEYSSLQDQWIREGDGYLLVYSIIEANTFDDVEVLKEKIARIRETDDFPMVVAGNKCDLESGRKVDKEKTMAKCADWGCPFLEASAKTRINTMEVFFALVREIRRATEKEEPKKNNRPFCTLI